MLRRQNIKKKFCTTREAAEMLDVSLRTAQLWVESGLLEAWKTGGGHRRIARESIERLLVNPGDPSLERQAAHDDEAATGSMPAPLSIMVVEDDAELRRLYEFTLSHWPLRPKVSIAGDGCEALVLMGRARPDLLITDLRMPDIDGFRMLRTLSTLPQLAGMTIVVVTGLDADAVARGGGVPDGIPMLGKPVPFNQLREIAERVDAVRAAANHSPR